MDQPKEKDAPTEYSFVTEERRPSGSSSLTLLRRSKRVLGDVDLGEASDPSPSESLTPGPATSKRREQVRKAQRTHRQRTQAYIKELENEVLRLRTSEAETLSKLRRLQEDVNSLLAVLSAHSIDAPDGITRESPPLVELDSRIQLNTVSDPIAATLDIKHSPSPKSLPSYPTRHVAPELQASYGSAEWSGVWPTADEGQQADPSYSQCPILQDPRIGIDFVLALERPCLSHLRESHLDYNDRADKPSEQSRLISGHLFTASLQLWKPRTMARPDSESYTVSTSELQRLLHTSLNIGVKDDELTPVQIWNLLKDFAIPEGQEREVLGRLIQELSKHTECLHFGTVVALDRLESVLRQCQLRPAAVG